MCGGVGWDGGGRLIPDAAGRLYLLLLLFCLERGKGEVSKRLPRFCGANAAPRQDRTAQGRDQAQAQALAQPQDPPRPGPARSQHTQQQTSVCQSHSSVSLEFGFCFSFIFIISFAWGRSAWLYSIETKKTAVECLQTPRNF